MFGDFVQSVLVFFVVVFGVGWLIATRLPLAAAEKLLVSVTLSLLGTFGVGWVIYVWTLPTMWIWALPTFGGFSLLLGSRGAIQAWRDADGRDVIIGQLLVAGWCVGWLATITSYAGGGWAGDWFEHWERARFFLEHQPLTQKFLGHYSLTARPPLVNVVIATLLALTRLDFAHYQLVSTLLASLVFLPAALLARRFGRDSGAIRIVTVLFLASPLLVQNATFAWTKLPTALFVLAGLYFFLRAQALGAPLIAALLCAANLAAGFLSHYSAGPYIVMLILGWIGLGWSQRREREWWQTTAASAAVGAALLAPWFGWALKNYGMHETFSSNSSVTTLASYAGHQAVKIALNARDTLIPHFLRSLDTTLVAQRSVWGRWSDWFFQCYQVNLPLAFGSLAWSAIIWELSRAYRTAPSRTRIFWGGFILGVVALGIATHGARDEWGLAHICLQALVLLGLAWLAARWRALSRGWHLILIIGAVFDLITGILLHGGVQSYAFDHWFAAGRPSGETLMSYSEAAFMNLNAKLVNHITFFSDVFAPPFPATLAGLGALLIVAVLQARPMRSIHRNATSPAHRPQHQQAA